MPETPESQIAAVLVISRLSSRPDAAELEPKTRKNGKFPKPKEFLLNMKKTLTFHFGPKPQALKLRLPGLAVQNPPQPSPNCRSCSYQSRLRLSCFQLVSIYPNLIPTPRNCLSLGLFTKNTYLVERLGATGPKYPNTGYVEPLHYSSGSDGVGYKHHILGYLGPLKKVCNS